MQQHLQLISKRTQPGRHTLVIIDGEGWLAGKLTDDIAQGIDILSIIKLPLIHQSLTRLNKCGHGFANII
jgi:hypothetical protein